jgi:hypothetical protein
MKRRERRRSGLLVYPKLQIKLIALQAGIMSLLLAGTLFKIDLLFHQLLTEAGRRGIPIDDPYFLLLRGNYESTNQVISIAFAGVTFGLFLMSLWLTHRIAGPIRRLQSYFAQLSENPHAPPPPLHFRKGDFFEDLPQRIETTIRMLQNNSSPPPSRKIADPEDPRDKAA